MLNFCERCGVEVDPERCAVTAEEAREFRELRVGQMVCMMCFHEIKWPHLTRPPEEEGMPGVTEEDWE